MRAVGSSDHGQEGGSQSFLALLCVLLKLGRDLPDRGPSLLPGPFLCALPPTADPQEQTPYSSPPGPGYGSGGILFSASSPSGSHCVPPMLLSAVPQGSLSQGPREASLPSSGSHSAQHLLPGGPDPGWHC